MKNFSELSDQSTVVDDIGDITILFCDIADFDELVRKNENNVVYILDKIFRKFDDLCVLHGIQKIETVGKTYMAAGGLKHVEQGLPPDLKMLSHTLRTINLAKDMINHIKEYQDGLKLKIGIHVGRPVMGVIGYHKPQFSLIGDVVNTTSRHCTTGQKGHIMISEAAFKAIENSSIISGGFKLSVVHTEMKGKGIVKVYHLYPAYKQFIDCLEKIADQFGTYPTRE